MEASPRRSGGAVILTSVAVGAALCALGFVLFVSFDIPPFHDERRGYPGIPAALGYAVGSQGSLELGAMFFGAYGAIIGLVIGVAILARRTANPH